jgi:hypothetical protein
LEESICGLTERPYSWHFPGWIEGNHARSQDYFDSQIETRTQHLPSNVFSANRQEARNVCKILIENLEGNSWEDRDVDGKIIIIISLLN